MSTFSGGADLWKDRGGHTKQVTPWEPPAADPVDLNEWRTRVALEKAQRALRQALQAAGASLPCREPGPNLWLSEDAGERLEAVNRCSSCPVIGACGAVAEATPDPWGVYGGHDYAAREVEEFEELRAVGSVARRNQLILRMIDAGIKPARLAEAAGISIHTVRSVAQHRASGGHRPQLPNESERKNAAELERHARHQAEVAERADDPRVKRLRQLAAIGPLRDRVLLAERAELVAELWAEEPGFWTLERLAVATGQRRGVTAGRILRQSKRGQIIEGVAS